MLASIEKWNNENLGDRTAGLSTGDGSAFLASALTLWNL
jgi:hypothetical protein